MRLQTLILILLCLVSCAGEDWGGPNERPLWEAVRDRGGLSTQAKRSPFLCELSDEHLNYMISRGSISHDSFSNRSTRIQQQGGRETGEIVAKNCGISSLVEAARKCAESWDLSPGHHDQMVRRWDAACYRLQPSQNCYYCIGLFANGL